MRILITIVSFLLEISFCINPLHFFMITVKQDLDIVLYTLNRLIQLVIRLIFQYSDCAKIDDYF